LHEESLSRKVSTWQLGLAFTKNWASKNLQTWSERIEFCKIFDGCKFGYVQHYDGSSAKGGYVKLENNRVVVNK
jgi:hypothetical protein